MTFDDIRTNRREMLREQEDRARQEEAERRRRHIDQSPRHAAEWLGRKIGNGLPDFFVQFGRLDPCEIVAELQRLIPPSPAPGAGSAEASR